MQNLTVELVNELLEKQGIADRITKISEPVSNSGSYIVYYVMDNIIWSERHESIMRNIPGYPDYNNMLYFTDGMVALRYSH
jgi:hypothetical protein